MQPLSPSATYSHSLPIGFVWNKYGESKPKGDVYPVAYYRCAEEGCDLKINVKKLKDGNILHVIEGEHNHKDHKEESSSHQEASAAIPEENLREMINEMNIACPFNLPPITLVPRDFNNMDATQRPTPSFLNYVHVNPETINRDILPKLTPIENSSPGMLDKFFAGGHHEGSSGSISEETNFLQQKEASALHPVGGQLMPIQVGSIITSKRHCSEVEQSDSRQDGTALPSSGVLEYSNPSSFPSSPSSVSSFLSRDFEADFSYVNGMTTTSPRKRKAEEEGSIFEAQHDLRLENLGDEQSSTEETSQSQTNNHKRSIRVSLLSKRAMHDGYGWRKYGQKNVVNETHNGDAIKSRSYYKCTEHSNGCKARKLKDILEINPACGVVTFEDEHTHNQATQIKRVNAVGEELELDDEGLQSAKLIALASLRRNI